MTDFQLRHDALRARYEERTNAYGVMVLQIVGGFNGATILALMSFIAARKDPAFIGLGVSGILFCGLALLLVLASVVAAYFFHSKVHLLLATADLSPDRTGYADKPALDRALKDVGQRRITAICLMVFAVLLTVVGALCCFGYLLGALL